MLSPKRTKYRKAQKGRIRGNETKSTKVKFGKYGLKALSSGRLTARQIEASRRTITRKIKRQGKLWIRVFPDIPVTSKPTEVRMGKGKGAFDYWACKIKPGKMLFELEGISVELAEQALLGAAAKLPVSVKFIKAEKL